MELRLIALILSVLSLAALQASHDDFGSTRGFTQVFQKTAWVEATGHAASRSSFNPLALPGTIQIGRDSSAKFVRAH